MNFIISAATDIGLTKNTNQDSFRAGVYETKQGRMVFAVLCDGMGGLSKGEVASSSLVNAYMRWADNQLPMLCEKPITEEDIRREWTSIAVEYNNKIGLYGRKCGTSMGTTLTAILLTETKYYIVNVGDSRIYEITDVARVLTKDQTVVGREIELGNLTPEQAAVDPRRNVLLQCVGASDVVYPDLFFGNTQKDAVYMLCSDGFRHEISAQEIHEYLNPQNMLSEEGMKQNMTALIELNKMRKETDNISVVSIRTF